MNDMGMIGLFLAAGRSQRMGKNKLELPFRDGTLGGHALKNVLNASLNHTLVIVRPTDPLHWLDDASLITSLKKWSLVYNYDSDHGQASSIHTGVRQAMAANAQAVIIFLADQPFLQAHWINELNKTFKRESPPFIAMRYNGIVHPPILFSKQTWPDLLTLTGDQGARLLFKNGLLKDGLFFDHQNQKLLFDVDDDRDYQRALMFDGQGIGRGVKDMLTLERRGRIDRKR
ncbi:NTP transferase domain-containing protein [Camelliibacillus cellulosilyticus]|uniref:NTP transferase domain-containing protein n=1 Tax=Camelliibacillus cellulosilyticus TaxID=2174486 RepID=A0ABV9GKF1_9BACL